MAEERAEAAEAEAVAEAEAEGEVPRRHPRCNHARRAGARRLDGRGGGARRRTGLGVPSCRLGRRAGLGFVRPRLTAPATAAAAAAASTAAAAAAATTAGARRALGGLS